MLTLGIYVVLGLACAGILFFVSVAIFGGSTTAKPPLTAEEEADARAHPPAAEPERSDLVPAVRDSVPVELPGDRAITGEDLDRLRLPVALRGYRMAETDLALDRLAQELRDRDATIARLQAEAAGESPTDARNDVAPDVQPDVSAGGLAPEDPRADSPSPSPWQAPSSQPADPR